MKLFQIAKFKEPIIQNVPLSENVHRCPFIHFMFIEV